MNLSGNHQKPEPGCRVTYKPYSQPSAYIGQQNAIQGTRYKLFSQPKLVEVLSPEGKIIKKFEGDNGASHGFWGASHGSPNGLETRGLTNMSLTQMMKPTVPHDAVRVRLDGPHGAPSELVWRHRVVMLVGAGIGVTPFASILRSIQLRKASKAPRPPAARGTGDESDKAALEWFPCEHVHFYWLCRSQDEFDWFQDLLQSAVKFDGPAKDGTEVNLFQTGEVELVKVKLRCGFRQFMGRPNWSRIFPNVAQQHPGENIGVFLCGPAVLRGELQNGAASAMEKDSNETTFTVHAENF